MSNQNRNSTGQTVDANTTGPTRFPWPPVTAIMAFGCAWALKNYATSLAFIPASLGPALAAFGFIVVALGFALDIFAIVTLRRARTTVLPTRNAAKLVTHGPYRISRNPIYLGNTLILLGFAFALNSLWFIVFALLAAMIVTRLQIIPEEKALAARFGKTWRQYSKRVSRWF